MPQIPGVPTTQPVELPGMNPRIAGRAGAGIADMAEEAQGLVSQQFQIEDHIRKAQEHVDSLAGKNELHAAYLQMEGDLEKTQNARDVPQALQAGHDRLNDISKRWAESPAAMQIQMDADSLRPTMGHLAQMRQIDLLGKEWKSQSKLQLDNLVPQLASAIRSGDKGQAEFIQNHINSIYEEGQRTGLVSDADKEQGLHAVALSTQKQLNEAVITSSDPRERRQAIEQLKSGKGGPLDLTELGPGDKSALREYAEKTDRELNNLSEAADLNGALNMWNAAVKTPELKGNFEAQEKVLQDPQWLTKHGIVDGNGKPDFVMAEKLTAEAVREEEFRKKVQNDHDEQALEKFEPMIDGNKMSRVEIDTIPGISSRARSILQTKFHQKQTEARAEWRMERSIQASERQEKRAEIQQEKQQKEETSEDLYGQALLEITSGKVYEPMDIREIQGLSQKRQNELISQVKLGPGSGNPYIKDGLTKITELPLQDSQKNELARIFVDQVKMGDLRGSAITSSLAPLLEHAKQRDAAQWIDATFGNFDPAYPRPYRAIPGRLPENASPEEKGSRATDFVDRVRPRMPAGATGKAKGKDGRMHWADASGKDYGVAE